MDVLRQRRWLIISITALMVTLAYIIVRPQPAGTSPSGSSAIGQQHAGSSSLPGASTAQQLTSISGPTDWVMEGHDPGRTRSVEAGMRLPLALQQRLGRTDQRQFGSPPTIAAGMALIEYQGYLRAYDLATGAERWAYPQRGAYISPAVAGERVYIRVEQANEGEIVALNLHNGSELWSFKPKRLSSSSTSYFGGHLTSPVVVDGVVFVGAGKEVYALDAASGDLRWEFAAQDYITSSATVAGGRVYISDFLNFYAIDQRSGELAWAHKTDASVYFSSIVAGDTVIVANGPELLALDANDGARRWGVRFADEALIPAAVHGSRAFVKSTSTLYALDVATGDELWRFHDLNYISLPAVAGDHVYVVSGMGAATALTILDVATGQNTHNLPVQLLGTSAPVIAGNALYVRAADGRVLGFWN